MTEIEERIEELEAELSELRQQQELDENKHILEVLKGTTWGITGDCYFYADNQETNKIIATLDKDSWGQFSKYVELGGIKVCIRYDDGFATIWSNDSSDESHKEQAEKIARALISNGATIVVNSGIEERLKSAKKNYDEVKEEFVWATEFVASLNE